MPLVSIIIPTINRPNLIVNALNSIYKQSYAGDIEIYVIDSSIDDATKIKCESYEDLPNRKLTYVKNRFSKNPIDNYIVGAEYIKGDYSKFLCDDDFLDQNFIDEAINQMKKNNAVCSITNLNIKNDINNLEQVENYYSLPNGIVDIRDVNEFIFNSKSIPTSDSASLMLSDKLIESFYLSLEISECTKRQFGFDFFINYLPVFDGTNSVFINKPLVNSLAGSDSLTMNARMSEISYCNFYSYLFLADKFGIKIEEKYKKNLKHKIAVSKIKSLLSKEFKTLTPQIELSGFLSIKLLFFNITKKVRIKFKYYLLNKFTD